MDKKSKQKRLLENRLEETRWPILNGQVERDRKGNWMYIEAGNRSVIDYVMGNEETKENIENI